MYEELEREPPQDVLDEAISDETVSPERYDISSFGADHDVDGLVRRINRGDIFVPNFQRDYVWKIPEASRFIESLLLGAIPNTEGLHQAYSALFQDLAYRVAVSQATSNETSVETRIDKATQAFAIV